MADCGVSITQERTGTIQKSQKTSNMFKKPDKTPKKRKSRKYNLLKYSVMQYFG